ncbi:MAG: band 7 protein [Deltaproteobacteria bacterium]|nr:band 7 protein [Deltaproteobacteria bacterium]
MAEIRKFLIVRHLKSEPSSHILRYRKGELVASGRGISFWFHSMSTSVAEVPADDREVAFLFHGRSVDFQDATAQGVITFRVMDPVVLARHLDFSIDLERGCHRAEPLDKLTQLITGLAQQSAWQIMTSTPIRELLSAGQEAIRERISCRLAGDEGLVAMGLSIVSVTVSSVRPTSELEKALEAPMREKIQAEADEAAFARRAQAVDKERAIQENELQNRIELARREEKLIDQQGQNARRQAEETAEAQRIAAEADARQAHLLAETDADGIRITARAEAEKDRLASAARAEGIRQVEGSRAQAEREHMQAYRDLAPVVLFGLAARELAAKLERIEHVNLSPELLGPLFTRLVEAGTRKLTAAEE